MRAVKNRAQRWVFEALIDIEQCLPFALLRIDSDNGVEFIIDQLLRYCTEHENTFTRTRPPSRERQLLHRAEELDGGTPVGGLRALRGRGRAGDSHELYGWLRLWVNFLCPQQKLVSKTSHGAPDHETLRGGSDPLQRLLVSDEMTE